MNWQQVCDDPTLQDLPYKIELNQFGQIVMSPASNDHGYRQMRLGSLLDRHLDTGKVVSECSVQTSRGVKVADVAWLSDEFWSKFAFVTPYTQAPEICVEVTSPSNSPNELEDKRQLYFEAGAKEVWICSATGQITYFDASGEVAQSAICPAFPASI